MEKYFPKRPKGASCETNPSSSTNPGSPINPSSPKRTKLDGILANLPADPGLRPPILTYDPNFRDEIRRAYLQKGPCQPKDHNFPQTNKRRFIPRWFDEYDWLEYSIEKDAAFCIYCYLFKAKFYKHGSDAFTSQGFKDWKHKDTRLREHIGLVSSPHNQARQACDDLMNQEQHLRTTVMKHSDQTRDKYRACLNASIDCTRFLLRQGLPFRGNDESLDSSNKGNYLELLCFLADHSEKIEAVVLKNAPGNCKLVAPSIQKDLVNACAVETIKVITEDMKNKFFSIMVDESRDISIKEQMAVVLRYVDNHGQVIERFMGVQHVSDTTSESLKKAVDQLFSTLGLSMSMLRGQGYDGASNMKGEFNGLKSIILREHPCAFYVHCFAHQLQLALVAVAKGNLEIVTFFLSVNMVVNIVGASCKRRDALRDQLQKELSDALENDCIVTGKGLNQETSLKRPGDTRWGSHYGTLLSIISMFKSVVKVLELIVDDGYIDNLGEANKSLEDIQTFEFVFPLFLMRSILGVTNCLSQALQRKDQDLVNAMHLVQTSKEELQHIRDNGFDDLLDQVSSFCGEHDIMVPLMDASFVPRGRSRRRAHVVTNLHHYRVNYFMAVIDKVLQELNHRFNEVNTELLICMACLSPNDSFQAFDKQKLVMFANFYPQDFSRRDILELEDQLAVYVRDMRRSGEFSQLQGIGSLAKKLVETGKHRAYNHVYKLVTLALVLPVATASVERAFSAMKIIKSPLRNRMGDQWLSDSLIVYIEKDVFACVNNETIVQRFHEMKTRRGQL